MFLQRIGLLSLLASAPLVSSSDTADETDRPRDDVKVRMLAELESVRADAQARNAYLGTEQVDELRRELNFLPKDGERYWNRVRLLAQELLRIGNTEEAVSVYHESLVALDEQIEESRLRAKRLKRERVQLLFDLGVAYLRLGEDQNCCLRSNPDSCLLPIRAGGRHTEEEGSRRAVEWFTRALEGSRPVLPLYRKARWLLNIAYMTLGEYPQGVPKKYRIDPQTFESDEPFGRFAEVGLESGLRGQGLAGGLVAEDLDGDGDLDILTSDSSAAGPLRLYLNQGDGSFREASERAGLTGLVGGLNLVSADYDNDGDVDVLVLRGGWWRTDGAHPNSLLRNDGQAHFTDVTFEAGLGTRFPTQTAAFADYDGDGDLDLYVGNEYDESMAASCELYRNDGAGKFVDVAREAGVLNNRYTKAVSWGDYDGDRWPDLYVSNMAGANRLYRNQGDGTFKDVALELGVERPVSGFPAWFFDYDNDGHLDIFAASYGEAEAPPTVAHVAASYLGKKRKASATPNDGNLHLYRSTGRGGFVEVASDLNLAFYALPMGSNFGDADNDGYLDLYLGTGYPYYEGLMPNMLLRNRAGRGFADVTTAAGVGHLQKGHGVAFADIDGDGDQDLLARMGGAYPGDAYRSVLFRNPGNDASWIKIGLVGRQSNRFGVGARLRLDVESGQDGELRSIYRTVGTGGSFGCNSLRQEIGLGAAERIARLEVYWPTSDRRQVFEDLPTRVELRIDEASGTYSVVER